MGEVIDGRPIAEAIKGELRGKVQALGARGIVPGLASVLVGEAPASRVYVRNIARGCADVGIRSIVVEIPGDSREDAVMDRLRDLSRDPQLHGILLQRPLPDPLREERVVEAIAPGKDVDCSHPGNLGRLLAGDPTFVPATPLGIRELLVRSGHPPEGKHVVIVGRSNVVGKPLAALLVQKAPGANATVTVCHSATKDLGDHTRRAEILVAAIGRPEFIRASMIARSAVVVDVGINRVADPATGRGYRMVGDVAYAEVAPRVRAITPVPGGVGPMTLAMLLANTVRSAQGTAETI